jgi:hypothetical protein
VQLLAALCLLVYVATTTAIGSRLLWLASRTGRLPERLLGAGSLLIGTIGLPLSVASGFGGPAGDVRVAQWVISELLTQVGVVCFYGFTQQVFRPGVRWAQGAIALAAVVLPACLGGAARGLAAAAPETLSVDATGGSLLACQFVYAGAFVWSAIEGSVRHRAARRQVAIGLLAPVVANRFLLFAIYGVACTGITLANAAAIVLRLDISTSLVVVVPSAVFAAVSSAAMFLAILPPARYLARFAPRS